ncbi:unnamed protein product [Mytilus coruscus]|uniref:Uncharacterized protein n=1 Tax=Mytilus coruscus TaxID=42192 RepID=A0A6J8B1C1_MYTCO|nr:unnamed protein product [Mytilus coruscus]
MENTLVHALSSGKLKLAKLLIEGGHNVNCCNTTGVSPLMLASALDELHCKDYGMCKRERKLKLAKLLIEGGHNIDLCTESGVTPLMLASNMQVVEENIPKKLQIIKCLLDKNANVNASDTIGRTALMYALFSGCKLTIQLLKSHGLMDSVKTSLKTKRTKSRESSLFGNCEYAIKHSLV